MKLFLILMIIFCAHAESPKTNIETRAVDFQNVLDSQDVQSKSSLSQVRIRTVLDAGIQIPGLSNAKLSPEIELFFTRSKH